MFPTLHGKSLVAGRASETSGRPYHATSPLSSETLEPAFHEATMADVAQALVLADEAFLTYRNLAAAERATFLERVAEEIMALGEPLLERAHQETGLPLDRLTGERGRTVNQLRLFAGVIREGSWLDARIDTAQPERKPIPKVDLRRLLRPLGPIVVFGASNFPFAFSVAGGDTASALAAGCTVVAKAHPAHPGVSEMVAGAVARAVEASGLPAGVFSMVHGPSAELGLALVRHPLTKGVGFTGSKQGGRALFDAAAARPVPIPVFSEMSSLNPIFLLPGALREREAALAEGVKGSVVGSVGQFCTKPGLIFGLGGPELQSFAQKLTAGIEAVAPATMLHGGIRDAYEKGTATAQKIPGVVVLGASATAVTATRTEAGALVVSTEVEDFLARPELHEEVFGPYTLLVSAPEMADLVRIAQRLEGQLTASVHGTPQDFTEAGQLLGILERKAGRLICNGYPTGVEVCPSMHHGGPYPATTDERFTSVGTAALLRWARPVCYQNFPSEALPLELRNENAMGLMRLLNGVLTREPVV